MEALLERARLIGDPLADEAVDSIAQLGGTRAVAGLLDEIVQGAPLVRTSLAAFVERAVLPPAWVDAQRVRRGQQIFQERPGELLAILALGALPETFCIVPVARLLAGDSRLALDPMRRAARTAAFVTQVMTPGSLEPGGTGVIAAARIRLLHAAVRSLARASGTALPDGDAPMSQADLAATLLTFSWTSIARAQRVFGGWSARDAADYAHVWNVIGALLGIQESLLPDSPSRAAVLRAALRRRYGPSDAGRALATAFVQVLATGSGFAAEVEDPAAAIRDVMGEPLADMVGLGGTPARDAFVSAPAER